MQQNVIASLISQTSTLNAQITHLEEERKEVPQEYGSNTSQPRTKTTYTADSPMA